MKITGDEIQTEINAATRERDILRRVFDIIKESHWDDNTMISDYHKTFSVSKSLGDDINAVVQTYFPKWYTKQIRLHKSRRD